MNRNITGTIRKTDGTVWAGAVVEFELERSSYDQEAQYPSKPVRAVADEDGELDLVLWVNEEGLRPSKYICTLPDGSQFRFILPVGEDPVDLNELRESAIEEDSPTESQVMAFLPVMRQEARTIVQEELVDVNAEIDTKADQTALDATNANLAALDAEVDTKASQAALDNTNTSVHSLEQNLDALGLVVDGKADQSALGALEDVVSTKADQSALDTTNTNLATTNANLATTNSNLATANAAIATKADQSALNTTNTNLAAANALIATKANQSALNITNASLAAAQNAISLKASQDDMNAAFEQIGDVTIGLNATNAELDLTQQDVAALNIEISNKAEQADLDTANQEISIRARQTALNTTNSNLAALTTVVGTKADQISLEEAVTDLEIAISQAQTTLQNLIDQKAPISHNHQPGSVRNLEVFNGISYFDEDGLLTADEQFTFRNGNIGLGTDNPQVTLDLTHPGASQGSQAHLIAHLDSENPFLRLSTDPTDPQTATIALQCGGMKSDISLNNQGTLLIGSEHVPVVEFNQLNGSTFFRGFVIGGEPTTQEYLESGSFGFFMTTHGQMFLVFNYEMSIFKVEMFADNMILEP